MDGPDLSLGDLNLGVRSEPPGQARKSGLAHAIHTRMGATNIDPDQLFAGMLFFCRWTRFEKVF